MSCAKVVIKGNKIHSGCMKVQHLLWSKWVKGFTDKQKSWIVFHSKGRVSGPGHGWKTIRSLLSLLLSNWNKAELQLPPYSSGRTQRLIKKEKKQNLIISSLDWEYCFTGVFLNSPHSGMFSFFFFFLITVRPAWRWSNAAPCACVCVLMTDPGPAFSGSEYPREHFCCNSSRNNEKEPQCCALYGITGGRF